MNGLFGWCFILWILYITQILSPCHCKTGKDSLPFGGLWFNQLFLLLFFNSVKKCSSFIKLPCQLSIIGLNFWATESYQKLLPYTYTMQGFLVCFFFFKQWKITQPDSSCLVVFIRDNILVHLVPFQSMSPAQINLDTKFELYYVYICIYIKPNVTKIETISNKFTF